MSTFRNTVKNELVCETIKAHRTTIENAPTTESWTDCDGFALIADESSGTALTLNADTKTIEINRDGIYEFFGCVHYQNNSGGAFAGALVACRLYINGTTEMKCSQRCSDMELKNNGENTLSYTASANLSDGDTVMLQYYTDESDVDFISNTVFDTQVAWTLTANWCGNEVDQ